MNPLTGIGELIFWITLSWSIWTVAKAWSVYIHAAALKKMGDNRCSPSR